MNNPLSNYLLENWEYPVQLADAIQNVSRALTMDSEQIILKVGQVCDFVVFIESGVLRIHEVDRDGNNITKFFFSENQFVTNLKSYNTLQSSEFFISAVTPCKLHLIYKKDTDKIPEWFELFNQLVQEELSKKIQDQYFLRNHSASEKYMRFMKIHGDIINRVPLQYIASYIGIAPQSLSRVRRSL